MTKVISTALAITHILGHHLHLGAHAHLPARGGLACETGPSPVAGKPHRQTAPEQDQWMRDHGLFLLPQDHFPQFGLMPARLLASPLSSLLLVPLTPTG